MTVYPLKSLALAVLLTAWLVPGHAQSNGLGTNTGKGATLPQTRPAPVSGRIGSDPAAVALRPAHTGNTVGTTSRTSTATQVPPPANPNEPLLLPGSETPSASTAAPAHTPTTTPTTTPTRQKSDAASTSVRHKPHVDRTKGVKRPRQTTAHQHVDKTKGKLHHAPASSSVAEGKKARKNKSKDKLGVHHVKKAEAQKHVAATGTAKPHVKAKATSTVAKPSTHKTHLGKGTPADGHRVHHPAKAASKAV